LGTPFGGSFTTSWGDLILRVLEVVKRTDRSTPVMKHDEEDLCDLRKAFPEIIRKQNWPAKRIGVIFFFEELETYKIKVLSK
jgi:hypothetical protein